MQVRTTFSPFAALLMLSAMGAACGGDGAASDDAGAAIRDSAGVQIVENTGEGTWPADGGWTMEEVLTIGEAAGDPNYQFGQITGIGVASDGRIAVLDQQAQHVRVYGPDGIYQRTIGGPGSGPGQFSSRAAGLFIGRGDTIIVADMGNQRINIVPIDGESTSVPMHLAQGIPLRFDMTEDGDLVVQLRSMSAGGSATEGGNTDVVTAQTYDGTITDTLLTPERGKAVEMGGDGPPSITFFAPEPMWTMLSDDRIASATNDEYRISISGPDGGLETVITRATEPRPVTEADQEVVRGLLRDIFEERQVPAQFIERQMSLFSFADTWPVFTQLRGGPDGTLWVQRLRYFEDMSDEELENWNPQLDQGSREWDIYEADGRYAGMVTMPEGFTPFKFEGHRVYGVFRDDIDVQYVRVYQLNGDSGDESETSDA